MRSPRGFTLIEAMLALALLLILAATAFPLMSNLTRSRDRLQSTSAWLQSRSAVGDLIERALLTAAPLDARGGPGFIGEPRSLRLATRWEPIGDEPELLDLRFEFDAERSSLRVHRGGPAEQLATGIERARFRYHDGRAWVERFRSTDDATLPAAVELALWRARPNAETDTERPPDALRVFAVPDARPRRSTP